MCCLHYTPSFLSSLNFFFQSQYILLDARLQFALIVCVQAFALFPFLSPILDRLLTLYRKVSCLDSP
jgi:hypothetical protein